MGGNGKYVDFHALEAGSEEIDARLRNWAAWCIGPGHGDCAPMFRGFQSPSHWHGQVTKFSVDVMDAQAVERGVGALVFVHGAALRWAYVYRYSPVRAAGEMEVSTEDLRLLLIAARKKLREKLAES